MMIDEEIGRAAVIRDLEQDETLEIVKRAWRLSPHLRLGQLLALAADEDPLNVSDKQVHDGLLNLLGLDPSVKILRDEG